MDDAYSAWDKLFELSAKARLLPCPFCGCDPHVRPQMIMEQEWHGVMFVSCKTCGPFPKERGYTCSYESASEAVEAIADWWNHYPVILRKAGMK